jgi:hypothetical protein
MLRLWRMTGFKKIDPAFPLHERLPHLQTIAQQMAIERAHSMEVLTAGFVLKINKSLNAIYFKKNCWVQLLLNASGETLDLLDEERIREVADYTVRLRYQGHSTEEQLSMARLAAGILPASIVNRFADTVRHGDKDGSFTLFSAHDNTLVALLAQFGLRI